jgi:hypothetical protein
VSGSTSAITGSDNEDEALHLLTKVNGGEHLTHLARLRRFARILTGSQQEGDFWAKGVLTGSNVSIEDLNANRDTFIDSVRALVVGWEQEPIVAHDPMEKVTRLERKSLRELSTLEVTLRAPFVATWIEEFTRHELAFIFQTHQDATMSLRELVSFTEFSEIRKVLISGEVEVGRMMASYFTGLPYAITTVNGWAMTERALADATFDLMIVDPFDGWLDSIRADGSNSVKYDVTTMWLSDSSSTDRFIASFVEGPLAVRSLDEVDFEDAIQEALFIEPHRWAPSDESFGLDEQDFDSTSLEPAIAPIDAEIVNGRLTLAASDLPTAALALDTLSAVREQHLEEAKWQADEFKKSNGAPRVQRHLDALVSILQQPLSEQMIIRLAVGTDGIARQLSAIEAEMMPMIASDIASMVAGLQQFVNQFSIARQFRAEAALGKPLSRDDSAALASIYQAIVVQPASIVDPAITIQLSVLEQARAQSPSSALSDVAHLGSLANIAKAPARAIKAYSGDLLVELRKGSIKALSTLIIGLASAAGLHHLSVAFPEQFAAVYVLLTRAKKQLEDAGLDGAHEEGD